MITAGGMIRVSNTVRPEPHTQRITYDGNTDWEAFIVPFERMAKRYEWSEVDQINWLFDFMYRPPLRYLCGLAARRQEVTYEDLINHLSYRFGKIAKLRAQLASLTQGNESVE